MEELHPHCLSCVNRRCMIRLEPGVSCELVGCPLVCGAVFHSCKAPEHRLLCPLERVPCLNSGFGCPFTLPRCRLAKHLEVCPGSVVCCTMEWNRWPVSYADRKSYEHLSCGGGGGSGGRESGSGSEAEPVEQLDMALALQDQRMLLESLRVTTTVTRGSKDDILPQPLIQDQPLQYHHQHQQQLQQQQQHHHQHQQQQQQQQQQTQQLQQPSQRPSQVELARGLVDMQQESYSELYKASVETSRSLAAALDILTSANKEMDLLMDSFAEKEQRNGASRHSGAGGLNGECRHDSSGKGARSVEMKDSGTDSECELGAVGGVDLNHSNGMSWEAHNGFGKSVEVIIDGKDSDGEERELPRVKPRRKKEKPQCTGFHRPDSRGGHRRRHAKHKLPGGGHNGCFDLQPELVLHSAPIVMVQPSVPQQHASITVPFLSLPVQRPIPRSDQRPLLVPNHHLMLEDEEEEFHMNGEVGLQPLVVVEGEGLALDLEEVLQPLVVVEEELQEEELDLPPLVVGEELDGVELQPLLVEAEEGLEAVAMAMGPDGANGDGPQSADHWLERKLHNLQVLQGVFNFNGRRALYPYRLFRAKMEDKAVDTLDLEVSDDPMGLHGIDLITAALLFCLGDSPSGRGISDSRFVDSFHMDFGTQTFSFPSAILATSTMVGDIASASACDHASPQLSNPSPFHTLRLDLVLECVARYQTKQRSMFTFVCGQLFRRDEFSSHFKNVHGDIHAGLNGWMEQRCPLAYYGCTYSQRRFCPSLQGSRVVHDRHLGSFGVQFNVPGSAPALYPPSSSDWRGGSRSYSCRYGNQCDHLSSLPFELLQHVASFLDGFSLCQLSRVSRTMRDVCATLLQGRGMVVLLWRKVRQLDGSNSWQIKDKVWRFSTAFGTVNEWKFANISSMADHLKTCKFNTVTRREEAIPLPCMCFTRELTREGRSLRSVLKPVL
ncbi:hypothetical protein ACEWY4_005360 [Coilia grayii]|uniref:F-box protein 30 n=1 Tax=Coilia grayii TaxID=363190 RepID=A0ABD1KI94_9TELE